MCSYLFNFDLILFEIVSHRENQFEIPIRLCFSQETSPKVGIILEIDI